MRNRIRNSAHTFLHLVQYWFELPFHILIVQFFDLNMPFGYSNNVQISINVVLMMSEEFAEQTFDPVAVNSIADLFAYCRPKPNPGFIWLPCPDKEEKA